MSAKAIERDRKLVLKALERDQLSLADFHPRPAAWRIVWYALACWLPALVIMYSMIGAELWQQALLFLAMGVVQHAMLNVVHEASHYSLHANRAMNELLGDLLFALPLGFTVDRYRVVHIEHHRALGTEQDPSGFVTDPARPRRRFLLDLFSLLLGRVVWDLAVNLLGRGGSSGTSAQVNVRKAQSERTRLWKCALYHLPVLAVLWWAQLAWLWFLWVLCVVTLLPFLDGLRTAAEHRFAPHDFAGSHTRSHHRWLLVSLLCAPVFQYHWEHHLFPMVPHHQLRRLHFRLVALGVKQAAPVRWHFFGALVSGLTAKNGR
jgi:fatty acid desaturase